MWLKRLLCLSCKYKCCYYDCCISYMDAKATEIEYFWAYELFFLNQQAICKISDSLDGGFEK